MTAEYTKVEEVYSFIKKARRKGLTIAEIQELTGWDGEAERASISSLVSRMVRNGEVEAKGQFPRGSGGRLATVYTTA